jgi:hypothetical protein
MGRLGSLARGAAAGNGDLNRIRVERIIDRVIEDNQRPTDCGASVGNLSLFESRDDGARSISWETGPDQL